MQKKQMPDFTFDRVFKDDGSLEFRCNFDLDIWPWQALHPHDPIYLQTINFWTSFEAGTERGEFTAEKWTALTETSWEMGPSNIGRPVRGVAAPVDEENIGFEVSLYDAADALVYRLNGKGVIFQNRDFGAWRQAAKDKVASLPPADKFEFASHKLTGRDNSSLSFISDIWDDGELNALALITSENGFVPHHPFLTGSGDHVNATHLHELGYQFTRLYEEGHQFTSHFGKMYFKKYVELDYPILITMDRYGEADIMLHFSQAGERCASMSFYYELTAT